MKRAAVFCAVAVIFACEMPPIDSMLQKMADTNNTFASLEIIKPPDKTAYELGEPVWNLDGIEVLARRYDGSAVEIPAASLTVENFSTTMMGPRSVWIVYQGGVQGGALKARLWLDIVEAGGLAGAYKINSHHAGAVLASGRHVDAGAISASRFLADEAMSVKVFVQPCQGFKLTGYTVVCNGSPITVSDDTFEMPAGDVTLQAQFELLDFKISASFALKNESLILTNGSTRTSVTAPAWESGGQLPARFGDIIYVRHNAAAYTDTFEDVAFQYYDAQKGVQYGPRIWTAEEADWARLNGINTADTALYDGAYTFEMPPGDTVVSARFSNSTIRLVQILSLPTKQTYNVGEGAADFDLTGFEFKITYDDLSVRWGRCTTAGWQSSADGILWESASGPALSCFSDSYGVSPFETRATGRRLVRFTIDGIQAVRSDPFEITVNAGSDVVAKYFNNAALPEYYYLNLQTALQEASTNGGLITLLKEEISVDSTLSIAPNSSLEIAPGTQSVIKRHNFSGPLFTIATGTVTLSGALTLDGTGTAAGPLVKITGGAFGINAGVVLKNNNRTSGSGGAVEITGGTFTMRGGSISSNSAPLGGGVYIGGNARFDFSGGFLSGNTANTGNGIYNNGTFTMAGAAYAAAGNDVYLANSKTIAVNSALLNGPAPVIQITPYSYSIGISVLSGNAYSSEYTKFTLAANNDRYGINAQGLLAKKIGDFSVINSTPSPMIFVPEGNITVSGAVVIPAGKDVTIATPAGDSVTISRGSTYTGEIFNVTGGSLTLGGGGGQVVVEGNSGATGALVNVSEQGTLTIQDGTVLQNNERSSSEIGGGLYVTGGSTLIMTGGKIHKNKAGNSGGIELQDGSRFDMRGGEICYNEGGTGGGVQLRADTNSIMTMTGGSIHHNRANYGGGVHIGAGSTLFINAPAVTGSIFENTAINTPPNVRKNGYFYVNETDATGY